MVTFAIIAAVGLGLLILTSFLDEIFSFGDDLFSGVTLGAGAMIFGASGMIGTASGLLPVWSYVIATGLGIAALFLSRSLTQMARSSESADRPSLIGVEGNVTVPTGPGGGEVRLQSIHEMEPRLAWSDQIIPTGTRIVVVAESGKLQVAPLTTTQNEA